MSYEFYKLLHLFGIFTFLTGLVGTVVWTAGGGSKENNAVRGLLGAFHGVGLLIVLVAGFGLHAKAGIEGFPLWFMAKMGMWLVLGGLVALPSRQPGLAKPLILIVPLLALFTAWLGIAKPF